MAWTIDYDKLSLTEFIKLRESIEREIHARFEQDLALVFSDVVGSTAYFERHGVVAGRALLQRHVDFLRAVPNPGRIVDTAGDGAFVVFPDVSQAAAAMEALQNSIARDNAQIPPEQSLGVRVGIHWGCILTDGALVTGDGVNLAARIASSASRGEILLSRAAASALDSRFRPRCKPLGPREMKGITDPVEIVSLEWRDPALFPRRIRIQETGEEIEIPSLDVVRFGRLETVGDQVANEVVLTHPNDKLATRISRWHIELHRKHDGLWLHPVSKGSTTTLNGQVVRHGDSARVRPGDEIRLSGILTLRFAELTEPTMSEVRL